MADVEDSASRVNSAVSSSVWEAIVEALEELVSNRVVNVAVVGVMAAGVIMIATNVFAMPPSRWLLTGLCWRRLSFPA